MDKEQKTDEEKITEIKSKIEGYIYNLADEKDVQVQIEKQLEGLNFTREHKLSKTDVIDFFREEDGFGIEVKVKGQATAIFRQCKKYCSYDEVKTFILVTSKSMGFPEYIEEKPCYYISLSRGML